MLILQNKSDKLTFKPRLFLYDLQIACKQQFLRLLIVIVFYNHINGPLIQAGSSKITKVDEQHILPVGHDKHLLHCTIKAEFKTSL